tara:strand:+ start:1093 stop:2067 length:975 start_codon:yes stop_codon:yes gene_type:complete
MAKTLGQTVNSALRTIGEPDIVEFTATNQLQNILIDTANEAVHDILEAARFRWGEKRDAFTTHAKLTTGGVNVTNGSTGVTSTDGDGAGADNFTNVAVGDFIRVGADLISYEVASVSTGASPDTLGLGDSYLGTTVTSGSSYTVLRDVYGISIANLDEIVLASYGDDGTEIKITDIQDIHDKANGDLHRNTSGRPSYMAEVGVDSSDNPKFLLWPYPDTAYLVSVWATTKFTSNTTFATNMFNGDAPDIAYDAVSHKLRERACIYDEDNAQAQYWGQQYDRARFQVIARESRQYRDGQNMSVETYRRSTPRGHASISQIVFDRV